MLILDTNLLSRKSVANLEPRLSGPLFASSVSAQEVLGMQRPGRESGYRYALPLLDERVGAFGRGILPEVLLRWVGDHAKSNPVSKRADRQVVPRSRLRAESLELGHLSLAVAHERGYDGMLRAYASRGLPGKTLKPVLSKWEFLRDEIAAVIPLDEEIASRAVHLSNLFVQQNLRVKGTYRNTPNDMLVAATSHVRGIPLLTSDTQLTEFYATAGFIVRGTDAAYVATPTPLAPRTGGDSGKRMESRRYINRPPYIRSRVDYGRPPPLR